MELGALVKSRSNIKKKPYRTNEHYFTDDLPLL